MDTSEQSQVIISFCSGLLGIERGIEQAMGEPLTVAAYVEIEAFVIENILAGMEAGVVDAAPIWTDCKTFPAHVFRNRIHGIIGGYPCQPFSHAGNRKGEEDPRHLWPYIKEHIHTIRPLWCFFENVEGHLNLGYRTVRQDLESFGYQVEEGIFSAEEVGAPHRRKRLFILAILGNAKSIAKREQANEANAIAIGRQAWGESGNAGIEAMADTEILGNGRLPECKQGHAWSEQGEGLDVNGSSEAMADNSSERLAGWEKQSAREERQAIERSGFTQWPAGQGSYQHPWEEPRTVEPGLGCTVNGYSFRNDLLRALGNGVVEQTAARAFACLMKKHCNELERQR